jgi:VanZ family protein
MPELPSFMRPAQRPTSWQQRSSPLARTALLAYVVLAIYAGLSPWSGWRDLGVSPLAFVTAPLPRHLTSFDIAVNIAAYFPLGVLGMLALHPRAKGAGALVAVGLLAFVVAGTIEALQTFLPPRVPSNVDLATNILGAFLGAVVTMPAASHLIDRGRLAQVRARWFRREASPLLVVMFLWPLAQSDPGSMLFGNGRLVDGLPWLDAWVQWPFGEPGSIFGPAEFVMAEAFTVSAALLATGLALASAQPSSAPRKRLLLALLGVTLCAKALAYAVLFGPERAMLWLTPGAIGGLSIGIFTLLIAAEATARPQAAGSLVACVLWLVAVNVVPENPYHLDSLAAYRPGRLVHFTALSHWLSLAWPFALMAALVSLHLRHRPRA